MPDERELYVMADNAKNRGASIEVKNNDYTRIKLKGKRKE